MGDVCRISALVSQDSIRRCPKFWWRGGKALVLPQGDNAIIDQLESLKVGLPVSCRVLYFEICRVLDVQIPARQQAV